MAYLVDRPSGFKRNKSRKRRKKVDTSTGVGNSSLSISMYKSSTYKIYKKKAASKKFLEHRLCKNIPP